MDKTFLIKRETDDVFSVISHFSYWSDGAKISARVAWNSVGHLSSIRAQVIDARNGNHYLLVSPISFSNPIINSTARSLAIGESKTVTI